MTDWPEIVDDTPPDAQAFTPPPDDDRLRRARIDAVIADRRAADRIRSATRIAAVMVAVGTIQAAINLIRTGPTVGKVFMLVFCIVAGTAILRLLAQRPPKH